ncbi:MAG: hypothetical protein HFH71_02840, partial [Clostridia bacterium]|nr:hypothetical protein [Clostridia bacterium]
TSGAGLPTISVPESLADCLSNDAFNYTYTDEDGNTVSKSDMVAGKKYNVKATLKPEYAANFEFVDASGNVLPDASVSTSHEFDYSGENSGGNNGSNNGGNVPDSYYDWFKIHVITEIAVAVMIFIIIVIFIVLMFKLSKRKSDRRDKEKQGEERYKDK